MAVYAPCWLCGSRDGIRRYSTRQVLCEGCWNQAPETRLDQLEAEGADPDLIRVARAAKAVRVEDHADYGIAVVGLSELTAALVPLYREVES